MTWKLEASPFPWLEGPGGTSSLEICQAYGSLASIKVAPNSPDARAGNWLNRGVKAPIFWQRFTIAWSNPKTAVKLSKLHQIYYLLY